VQHFLPGQYEWFSLAAWAMKHLYQYGLGYPKGNTDWGKDIADPRNAIYEGRPDPVCPGYTGNAIARCLAGTGPTSWSLNGKESGVYDLVGNAWEWVDMLIGTAADHTIDAEYPGAGLTLPTANGNITTLYAPAKDGNRSLAADAFSPATVGSARAEYDNDYYWQATGQRAAIRGGDWSNGATLDCSACTWATPRPARATTSASAESVDLEIWRSTWYNSTSV
jgi:formylglycine-generating enzyme required for sulfatase activity